MAACGTVVSGTAYLSGALAQIDCQARAVGTYGFGALADPRSPFALAVTGLLTIFVILFGLRLLSGAPVRAGDVTGRVIKIGIVLTLATSWPAWHATGYALVMDAPGQVARSIGFAGASDGRARLQGLDDGMIALSVLGSGRASGMDGPEPDLGDISRGVTLTDRFALSVGRSAFLATTIGGFALVRIGAGILLALAPLMAGLLLFGGTIGLFAGWMRSLAYCALGALALGLVQAMQLTLMEPWMANVLTLRRANTYVPSAPGELMVLSLALAALTVGMLLVLARLAFHRHRMTVLSGPPALPAPQDGHRHAPPIHRQADLAHPPQRAAAVARAVAATLRREEHEGRSAPLLRHAGRVSLARDRRDEGQ